MGAWSLNQEAAESLPGYKYQINEKIEKDDECGIFKNEEKILQANRLDAQRVRQSPCGPKLPVMEEV